MKTIQLASSLRNAVSVLSRRLKKTLHKRDNFSLSEYTTLSYLYPDHSFCTVDLAALVMVKTQSMSDILNNLQGADIICRTPSVTDKRKTHIALTLKGKQLVEETRYERDEWLTRAIDETLSAAEQDLLEQAVMLMEKVMLYKKD